MVERGFAAGAALLDRDRRRKTFDEIDVRFFHLIEKLPGIGGQTLDVTPLAFGIERIESERRLSRAAQAGDNDQFLTRNLDVEILEIVLARTTDLDSLRRHSDDICRTYQSSTADCFSPLKSKRP